MPPFQGNVRRQRGPPWADPEVRPEIDSAYVVCPYACSGVVPKPVSWHQAHFSFLEPHSAFREGCNAGLELFDSGLTRIII